MSTPVYLLIVLLVAVAFIVLATSRFKWHPFIVLLMASHGIGFGAGMDPLEIGATIREGFGGILGYIALVILFGTLIGTILERTGSAITMANAVLKLLGNRFPGAAMSLMGYMMMRGVQTQNSTALSSAMRGTLEVDARTRSELMGFLRRD